MNEDFRRKEGAPGFNSHPDGEDSQIEFVLAQVDPKGNPTNGIVRIDRNLVQPPSGNSDFITFCAQYNYWDPEQYLNIWCMDVGHHGIYTEGVVFRSPISTVSLHNTMILLAMAYSLMLLTLAREKPTPFRTWIWVGRSRMRWGTSWDYYTPLVRLGLWL